MQGEPSSVFLIDVDVGFPKLRQTRCVAAISPQVRECDEPQVPS